MSCGGEFEAWRRLMWDKRVEASFSVQAYVDRVKLGHGFLIYCKGCRLILGKYTTLSNVPYMLKCGWCGASSKARFQTSFSRLAAVSVMSVQGDLGQQLLLWAKQGVVGMVEPK